MSLIILTGSARLDCAGLDDAAFHLGGRRSSV